MDSQEGAQGYNKPRALRNKESKINCPEVLKIGVDSACAKTLWQNFQGLQCKQEKIQWKTA